MIEEQMGFHADKFHNFMHVMMICEQFLTAHKKTFEVTVDCYLSSSAQCSTVAKKASLILEIKNKFKNAGIYSCILRYTVMLCLSPENHTQSGHCLSEKSGIDLGMMQKMGMMIGLEYFL